MSGYSGNGSIYDGNDEYNALVFVINQILKRCNHVTLVKVVKCTNNGGISPVGFIDIKPLVKFREGTGETKAHETVYNCLYFRLQGGANAIIIDPKPGDIGICCFADKDISSVKVNKKPSNPGSERTFDFSDGIYLGGVLNGTPSQYVRFYDNGIDIHSPDLVKITAPNIEISGQTIEINATISADITTPILTINGNMAITGTVSNQDVNIGFNHKHSGVDTGPSNTGNPI